MGILSWKAYKQNAQITDLLTRRQKGYLFNFSPPKQSKTRESRFEKYITKILTGKKLNDLTQKGLPTTILKH